MEQRKKERKERLGKKQEEGATGSPSQMMCKQLRGRSKYKYSCFSLMNRKE